MCFSAQASFAASALLVPAGAYCVSSAFRKQRRYFALAIIPLAFAVQQASEGVVWLALDREDTALARAAGLVFLFFALAFWPFWISVQAAALEKSTWRRRALVGFCIVNTVWFWVLFFPLAIGAAALLQIQAVHHSIQYAYADLAVYHYVPRGVLRVLYLASIAGPMLIASARGSRLPGVVLAATAAIAAVVFDYAFVSVWCFFAAIFSAYLCVVFWTLPHAGQAASPWPEVAFTGNVNGPFHEAGAHHRRDGAGRQPSG